MGYDRWLIGVEAEECGEEECPQVKTDRNSKPQGDLKHERRKKKARGRGEWEGIGVEGFRRIIQV